MKLLRGEKPRDPDNTRGRRRPNFDSETETGGGRGGAGAVGVAGGRERKKQPHLLHFTFYILEAAPRSCMIDKNQREFGEVPTCRAHRGHPAHNWRHEAQDRHSARGFRLPTHKHKKLAPFSLAVPSRHSCKKSISLLRRKATTDEARDNRWRTRGARHHLSSARFYVRPFIQSRLRKTPRASRPMARWLIRASRQAARCRLVRVQLARAIYVPIGRSI